MGILGDLYFFASTAGEILENSDAIIHPIEGFEKRKVKMKHSPEKIIVRWKNTEIPLRNLLK